MTITHKLTLDLQNKGKMPHINVVQGDAFTRQVDLVLENGGKPWLFPICEPVVRYCKPDGTVGVYDTLPTGEPAFSYAGNMLTLALAPQMLTCWGVVQVQVEMNAQDLKLATFTFLVVVEPGVALCGGSKDYVNWTKAFLPQTTGAKVGQFLQISKVDDVGRIAEMTPADDPAGEATNKAYEALCIANDVAQEMKTYSPSGTRSIAEAAMRMASERLVAPQSASVGQYFRAKEVDANGVVTAVEAVDATGGVTSAEKNLILTLLHNAAYTMPNMADTLEQLEALWSGGEVGPDKPDDPDEPDAEKTLTSISAVHSGGSVPVGTAVNALTGVVVTAHYSDGTSEPVTAYTLNGTIAEGSNTIAVSYGGKTATFEVIGVAESGGGSDNLAVINSNTAKNNNATAFVINEDDSITVTGGSDAYGYLLVNGLTPGASYEISMDQSTEHTFYFTSVYGIKVENATDDSGYDTKLIGMRNFSYGEKKIVTLSATNYGLIIYLYGSYDNTSRTNTFSNIIVKEV